MSTTALKQRFNAGYVRWAPDWAKRMSGHAPIREIDLSVLDGLRQQDAQFLRDARRVEHELLPRLGLCDDYPAVFPEHLRSELGRGVRCWQYPCQFAEYLSTLASYRIGTYLEIGTEHGGSFLITVEYLRRFTPSIRASGVDLVIGAGLRRYAAGRSDVTLLECSSASRRFRRYAAKQGTIDLVLIDGDHSRYACERDLNMVLDHANMVALHDIADTASPGVRAVWADAKDRLRRDFDFFEFTKQYDEVTRRLGGSFLGIGLAVRKEFAERGRIEQ